ncbi:MAG: hypothetical protein RL376_1029 [Verrucomicrobiota bacterium]|jgi:hypothetical protein
MKSIRLISLFLVGLSAYGQPVIQVSGTTYSAGQTATVRASAVVSTNSSVVVSSGANVTFQAGDSIVLNPGFSVQAGGSFTARLSTNKAQFIKQTVPARLAPGQVSPVSITLRNIGKTTWASGSGFKLGSQAVQDNTLWTGSNRVALTTSPTAPGQDQVFTFNITAPASPGTYSFQWLMLQEGVEWFGEITPLVSLRIDSYAPGDDDDGLPSSFTTDSTNTGVPDSVKAALGLNVNTPSTSVPGTSQGYQYDEIKRLTNGPGRSYTQDPENNIVSP